MSQGNERNTFRYVIGLIAVIGGLLGLFGLFVIEVPANNREPMLLALGVVLGWGGSVVNGEWGSSPAGRQMAQIGADLTSGKPINAKVTNTATNPVPTTEGAAPFADSRLGQTTEIEGDAP